MTPAAALAIARQMLFELGGISARSPQGHVNREFYDRAAVLADVLAYTPRPDLGDELAEVLTRRWSPDDLSIEGLHTPSLTRTIADIQQALFPEDFFDEDAARNLEFYEESAEVLYRAKRPILARMYRAMANDTYRPTDGVKLWTPHVDRAARMYEREFREDSPVFSRATRLYVAKRIEEDERDKLQRGEYREFPPR